MLHFFANFIQHKTFYVRHNTRIYLSPFYGKQPSGTCVGAVVGLNPGSAQRGAGTGWQALTVGQDKLLPGILKIVSDAYFFAKKTPSDEAYVQILNLFYICDHNSASAIKSLMTHGPYVDPVESALPSALKFFWIAYGHQTHSQLTPLKQRVLALKSPALASLPFYYSRSQSGILLIPPANPLLNPPKHPQGLLGKPVIAHISTII